MFKLQTALFLGFLVFFCVSLKNKKLQSKDVMCQAFGEDCDALTVDHYCCGKYKCVDFRCQPPKTHEVLAWAPKGIKCDPFHYCPKHFDCMSHRCHPIPGEEAKALLNKLEQ